MKNFNSLKDIELELKKRDLQRQITREQIKQNYLLFEQSWTKGLLSSTLLKTLASIGVRYLIKRITK
ncbi:MAG: hypothetical protein R2793_05005 [Flavobacteriaceae bacterium]